MRTLSNIRRSAIGAAAAWLLAACGGGGDVAAPPPSAPRLEIASIVVEDPQTGDIMFSHDDHWHGFPTVAAGGARTLRVHFVKQGRAPDDHDMPPRNEWFTLQNHADHSLPVVIEDPARASWAGDRLGGQLRGQSPGASRLSVRVLRGSTTVWEAPPLNFVIR
ncbi:MAG: hypothetical protein ACK6DP_05370 [Gemmatimonas sp.]|jgi:hypothetical protein|uniref:hypothetical protein n=1 Tax=Gemmatimonas sp. TaxID=1962908 RepID=UPI00391F59AF|nr:hypothetical protein [Gemmatimonadota bacterium]